MNPNLIDDDDINDLPDLESFKNMLSSLKSSIPPTASVDEIAKVFYDHAIMHTQLYGLINPSNFARLSFYRVRLNIDFACEDLGLIRTYSYPPASACKTNGRANIKGKSVFYCSDDALTAIYESKPKVGDIGYISIWNTQKVDRFVKYAICLPKDLRADNKWAISTREAHEYSEKHSQTRGANKAAQLDLLNQFLSIQFIEEREPYLLTSWLSDNLLYHDSKADFIAYPSIVANTQHCNLAFHPNSVDTLLTFKKVVRFKILEVVDSPKGLIMSTGKIAELNGSILQWRDAIKGELPFLGKITDIPRP